MRILIAITLAISFSAMAQNPAISRKVLTNEFPRMIGLETLNVITNPTLRGATFIGPITNSVGTGKLMRTDANGVESAVTIGTGIAFDGTTISASGSFITSVDPDFFEVLVGQLNLTNENLVNWGAIPTNALPTFLDLNSASNLLRADITDLQSATNGLNSRVGNLETSTNGLDSRVTTVEGVTNSFLTTNKVGSAAFNLTGDFQPASANLTNWSLLTTNTYASDVSNLQTATNGLNTRVGNLETATNGLNSRVATVEGMTNSFLTTNKVGNMAFENKTDYALASTTNNFLTTNKVGTIAFSNSTDYALAIVTNNFLTTNKSGFASANGVLTSLLNASNPPVIKTVSAGSNIGITDNITNLAFAVSGTVPTATTSTFVTGSPLTNAVTNLPSIGTAGTYRSVTFDAQGRETSGSNPTTFAGYAISDTSANLATAITDETGSGGIVFSNAPSFYAPIVNSATVSRAAIYDASGRLTNGTIAAADFPALTGDVTTVAGSLATTLARPHTVLCGNTGNAGVISSITWFQGVSTCFSNAVTTDVSGGTRSLMPRGGTLTNLYFIASGTLGNVQTNTITIMTNGVSTGITCFIQGTSATSASDLTHSVTILAGTEVGIRMATTSSVTVRKFAWAIEY